MELMLASRSAEIFDQTGCTSCVPCLTPPLDRSFQTYRILFDPQRIEIDHPRRRLFHRNIAILQNSRDSHGNRHGPLFAVGVVDADIKRAGVFSSASGGTVFLDEIGEMPLSAQSKILRVLENREIQRLGSARSQPVDIRVVAATNQSLEDLVDRGSFKTICSTGSILPESICRRFGNARRISPVWLHTFFTCSTRKWGGRWSGWNQTCVIA